MRLTGWWTITVTCRNGRSSEHEFYGPSASGAIEAYYQNQRGYIGSDPGEITSVVGQKMSEDKEQKLIAEETEKYEKQKMNERKFLEDRANYLRRTG